MRKILFLITFCTLLNAFAVGQEKRPFDCPEPRRNFFDVGGMGNKVVDINIKKLKELSSVYYKNDTAVFYNYIRDVGSSQPLVMQTLYMVEEADPNSFKILQGPYAVDNKFAYFHGFLVHDADCESFRPLTPVYSKDANNVFFKNCKIKDADLQSFKTINNGGYYDFAYDDNYLYFYSERVEIDKESFTIDYIDCKDCLKNSCRDKKYIYHLAGTSFDGYIIKKRRIDNL